jgi:hypothetical protein
MEILRNELETTTKRWAYYKMMQPSTSSSSASSLAGMSVQLQDDKFYKHLLKVFTRPLDEERNTLLHYAVYMEDDEMISYIVLLSRQVHLLPDVVLCENIRGFTANDYSLGCSVGSTVPTTMSALTETGKDMMKQRTLDNKSLSEQQKFNFQPLLWTVISVLIGRFIMNCNWIMSLIISGTSRAMNRSFLGDDDDDNGDGSDIDLTIIFYVYHLTWILLHNIFVYGRRFVNYLCVPWQIQILLMVFIPLNMKLKHFDFVLMTIPSKIFHHPLGSFFAGILPRKQRIAGADVWSFIILTIVFAFMKSLYYAIVF